MKNSRTTLQLEVLKMIKMKVNSPDGKAMNIALVVLVLSIAFFIGIRAVAPGGFF